jgi:hypothetical protein
MKIKRGREAMNYNYFKRGIHPVKCSCCDKQCYFNDLLVHFRLKHRRRLVLIQQMMADLQYKERSMLWAEGLITNNYIQPW